MNTTIRSRRLAGAAIAVVALFGLTACASATASVESNQDGALGTLKVGALATPAGDILNFVQNNLAADAGLEVVFTEFTDYNTPNTALSDGSVDANLFQNENFLANYNEQAGGDLVSLGAIYLPTAAFYSERVSSLDELQDGAKIAIPNDPTNEGRALKILADAGLIGITAEPTTLADVTDNPRNFSFIEVENATLPQAVPDVDTAFVTIAFALPAGLTADQAILVEGEDSDYFNVLAVRPEFADDARVLKLKELLQSDQAQQFMTDTWGGLVVPAAK